MRYRQFTDEDNVSHLIGQCLRNKDDAKRMYEQLIAGKARKIDLITGTVHLDQQEHDEFVARFSAEVEPTLWESSFRKH